VGYSKANASPILKLFLSRLEELRAPPAGNLVFTAAANDSAQ
jgi:hypothetical protein